MGRLEGRVHAVAAPDFFLGGGEGGSTKGKIQKLVKTANFWSFFRREG